MLPTGADDAFREAEKGDASLYLPTIAAAELYYLFEKKGWMRQCSRIEEEMGKHATFNYHSFSDDILNLFEETKAREIHDKIVISTEVPEGKGPHNKG